MLHDKRKKSKVQARNTHKRVKVRNSKTIVKTIPNKKRKFLSRNTENPNNNSKLVN